MKKIIIKYLQITLLVILVLSTGCVKNLEENPVSIISPSNSYKNDADFNAALLGAIRPLYTGSTHGYITLLMGAGAEDITSRSTAPELKQCDEFKPITTWGFSLSFWTNYYQTINACNDIIKKLPDATLVSAVNKASYEGQARYARAYAYFMLTRFFGEIPIITSENQMDAKNVAQSPVADVYKVIIEDLTFAESLPVSFSEKGRPTRGAAKALLSEVYLNMTGWPIKDASKYALARDKAKEVMDLNVYQLEPNFGDLWRVKNKTTSKEFIFSFFGSSAVSSTGSSLHQRSRPGEEGGWNDFMTEARFFNAFPAGPRKDASFWTVFADAAHTTWQNSRIGQPFIAKWRDGGAAATLEQGPVNNTGGGDGFWPVNRYAEILLIYAEAANMAEGAPSTAATDAINLVRRRASGYDPAVYPDLPYGMSQAAFDAAVISEREWELAFECKRWFDLVRKEQVVSANIDLYPNVKAYHALLPKPEVEINLIPGLKQNQGY